MSGHRWHWPPPISGRCSTLPMKSASAVRWCSAGSNVLLKKAWTACCTTRRASPVNRRSRRCGWAGGGDGLRPSASSGSAPDRACHGEGDWHLAALGAAYPGSTPASAAPHQDLHALQRPGVRGQAGRRIRPLCRPTHTVVLSVDEKRWIQALDRIQPGLLLKPGRCGTMMHDHVRHGTTTLFAALNVLDGTGSGAACTATTTRSSSVLSIRSGQSPGGKADPWCGGQLRPPQASKSEGVAAAAPALEVSLYYYLQIVSEHCRGLLPSPDPQAHSARKLPFAGRSARCHQAIPRQAQGRSSSPVGCTLRVSRCASTRSGSATPRRARCAPASRLDSRYA